MSAFIALISKDLRLLIRDRTALLLLLLAPLVVITAAGLSLSTLYRTVQLTLPVVNEDDGVLASRLVEALRLAEELEVRLVDQDEALRLVSATPIAGAALVIPEGFSDSLGSREPLALRLLTDPVKHLEVLALRAAIERAKAGLVAVSVAARVSVVQVLTHAGETDFEALTDDSAALASRLVERTVSVEEASVYGGPLSYNTFDQNVPGFSVTFLMLGTLFGVGLGLLDERDWGMIERLAASPLDPRSPLAAKVVSRFVVGVVQMVLLFGFGKLVFGVTLGRSWSALALVIAGVAFASSAFGLLAAAVSPSRDAVLPVGTIAVVAMAAVGGCWWPITVEPMWLQSVARVFPTTWAMGAFNDLMLRGRGLEDVWPSIAVLVAFGMVYTALGAGLYRRKEEAI
jgi:ABC-2 type transport system permease protein